MKIKKPSKRQTLKQKFSIEKKVRSHNKKVKKIMRKNPSKSRSNRPRLAKIPNKCPFKDQLLQSVIQRKENEQLLKQKKILAHKQVKQKPQGEVMDDIDSEVPKLVESSLEDLASTAKAESEKFERHISSQTDTFEEERDACQHSYSATTRKFIKDIHRIIDQADVILEILDARDPEGCRHPQIEETVIQAGKKLILILNKVDLVPKDIAEKWVIYLRQFYPCEIFKAATSKSISPSQTSFFNASENELTSTSSVFGMQQVVNLLKNYSRLDGHIKGQITVGIIGFPNVGKSSVINSLCRNASATHVGAQPGITQGLQEIAMDRKIRLIDSPGVIFPQNDTQDGASLVLRNTVQLCNAHPFQLSKVKDCVSVVEVLIRNYPVVELTTFYKVAAFDTVTTFLEHVAQSRGKLLKKGQVDYEGAARCVLQDWISGKLRYYSLPPDLAKLNEGTNDKVVTETRILTVMDIPQIYN